MPADAETAPRRTPLYDLHQELGGKLVDFAGWSLPVNYPLGIIGEHLACRETAALFDVSHMGQVLLHGERAAAALEALLPSSLVELPEGKARYSFFTDPAGGILDDLIVSNAGAGLFLVVNAAMRAQDLAHLEAGLPGLEVEELAGRALLAVQGPAAEAVVGGLAPAAAGLGFMQTCETRIAGVPCRLSRLGYTGEDGFEISLAGEDAEAVARRLLAHPALVPAGLGARDSLRLEAGLPLYGNDLGPETSPVEAGLAWAIQKRRRQEGGFPGAARILRELAEGPARRLVGLRPEGRAPARSGVEILDAAERPIGRVTSGGFSPSLGAPISMGYLAAGAAAPDSPVGLLVRGKSLPARVAALPFVPHRYRR